MNDKPLLRFFPSLGILRSFAVLRRFSLATLAQRLRQSQDDNRDVGGTKMFFTTSHDDSEVELSTSMLHP